MLHTQQNGDTMCLFLEKQPTQRQSQQSNLRQILWRYLTSGKHLQRLNVHALSLCLGKYNNPAAYFLSLQTNTFSSCHNTLGINPLIYSLLKYNQLIPFHHKSPLASVYLQMPWNFSWCLFFIYVAFGNIIYCMFVRNNHLLPLGDILMHGWQILEKLSQKIKVAIASSVLPATSCS